MTQHLPTRAQTTRCIGVVVVAAVLLSVTTMVAKADDGDARKVLKAMTDFMVGQKTLSATYDTDIEVITPDLQKIQFTASGNVLVDRQAGLRVTRTGGYAGLELVFDGKTMIVHNRHGKAFTRLDVPGSLDEMVHRSRTAHFVEMPGADLLAANAYERLTEEVLDAKHIGRGVIDGSSASIWPSAIPRPTGSSGSRPANARSLANTSSPARPSRRRPNTPCASRSCARISSPARMHSRSRRPTA